MSSYHPFKTTTRPPPSSSTYPPFPGGSPYPPFPGGATYPPFPGGATYPPFPSGTASQVSSNPALNIFISCLIESIRTAFSRRRPLRELINHAAFSRPMSLSDATTRLSKNASYFRANYLIIVAMVLAFSIMSHPFSLCILIGLIASWLLYFFRPPDQPIVIYNRVLSDKEMLGTLVALTVFVVFLTNVGSVFMSSILTGVGIVCIHGAFRDPSDLFLDEQDISTSGLFSLIGRAASSVGSSPGRPRPNVVPYV